MFKQSLSGGATKSAVYHWFLMAFLAGNINAGGFMACGRFVTHVTGFATLFGLDVAENRWDAAVGILSVPMYFLLGVMASAYLIDRPFRRGGRPHYAIVMGLEALCLLLAAYLGNEHYFGVFGEAVRLKRDYFFLALLCCASGLQNAALTTSSGASVRTTHLTGLTTDLGIGIVRAMSASKKTPEGRAQADQEWKWTRFRIGTLVSFALGSAVGAVTFLRIEYLGFLLPASLAMYAMLVAAISLPRLPYVSARSPR